METELAFWATTFMADNGGFHPAVQGWGWVKYWPNVRFATEEEAYEWACLAVKDVLDAANAVTKGWNVVKKL